MTVPGWKVVFFSVVVFWAAAEVVAAGEEEEAVGEQMEDLEGDLEGEEDQPGMEGLDGVDHLGM